MGSYHHPFAFLVVPTLTASVPNQLVLIELVSALGIVLWLANRDAPAVGLRQQRSQPWVLAFVVLAISILATNWSAQTRVATRGTGTGLLLYATVSSILDSA